jgi:hypothetical protein
MSSQGNHTPLGLEWNHHVAQVIAQSNQPDAVLPSPDSSKAATQLPAVPTPPKRQQLVSVHPEAPPVMVDLNENGIDDALESGGEETPTEELAPLQEAKEHEIQDDQVQQHVDVKPENIKIPPSLQKHGLTAVESTQFPNYQNVKLPIPDDKVLMGQNAPVTSSLRWLSTFATYLLWRAHITLKSVHGKVVRVVRR